jgi:hypothetical protein
MLIPFSPKHRGDLCSATNPGTRGLGKMGRKGKHHKPPYSSSDPFLYRRLTRVQLVSGFDPLSLTGTRK